MTCTFAHTDPVNPPFGRCAMNMMGKFVENMMKELREYKLEEGFSGAEHWKIGLNLFLTLSSVHNASTSSSKYMIGGGQPFEL